VLSAVEVLLSFAVTLPRTCAGDLVAVSGADEPRPWWALRAVARMPSLEDRRPGIFGSDGLLSNPGFYPPEWRGVPFGPFWLQRHTPLLGPDDDVAADLVDPSLCADSPLKVTGMPSYGPTTLTHEVGSDVFMLRQGYQHHFAFRRELRPRHMRVGRALAYLLSLCGALAGLSLMCQRRSLGSWLPRWAAVSAASSAALMAGAGLAVAHEHAWPIGLPADLLVPPPPPASVADIVAGGNHTCVRLDNGAVRCWGNEPDPGPDGLAPGLVGPRDVPLGGGVAREIVAGRTHSCALVDDDFLQCWGPAWESPSFGERPVNNGPIAAGADMTCANYHLGDARCWTGAPNDMHFLLFSDKRFTDAFPSELVGTFGTCGYGAVPFVQNGGYVCAAFQEHVPPPWFQTFDLGTIDSLALGPSHMCAVIRPGRVRCWGDGAFGQLGMGNLRSVTNPLAVDVSDVNVGGLAAQVAVGAHHTCVRLTDGRVRCWGRGSFGQLGYGNPNNVGDSRVPAEAGDVPVGGRVIQVVAGDDHTCARLDTGRVRCWGRANQGQLGYPARVDVGASDLPQDAGDVPIF